MLTSTSRSSAVRNSTSSPTEKPVHPPNHAVTRWPVARGSVRTSGDISRENKNVGSETRGDAARRDDD